MGKSEGKPETGKTEVVYCRVNATLKKRLEKEAQENENGEAEAVIVRRALHEYFDRRDHPEKYPVHQPNPLHLSEPVRTQDITKPASPPPAPHDLAAAALGKRAVREVTGEPEKSAEATPEDARIRRKVSGIARRAAHDLDHPEKRGK